MGTWKILLIAAMMTGTALYAQEEKPIVKSAISRRVLLNTTIAPEKKVSTVEIQEVTMGPMQKAPLHLHPCPTLGIVTEGAIAFQIEGQAVQILKAGDAFYEPPDVRVVRFDNEGNTPAKFVVHYLLGKDEHDTVRILSK